VVADGETGLLVAPGDHVELGLRIVDLLRDPSRARALGDAARRRMIDRFSPETIWESHFDLYESVTGGRRVTRAGKAP
jgi:glycosyltransferase involved in cell wall biosynthesis